ncbi:MAG: right-handed parallel beta-helix repeat-containing protein [Chloroflexota bacterium]
MPLPLRSCSVLFVTALFFASIFTFIDQQSASAQRGGPTEVGGLIKLPERWLQVNSPYIITSTVVLTEQAFITIEPGVVIKSQGGGIIVQGFTSIAASGTVTDPVVFTSFQDDAYGGDTNNDGNLSSPAPGDWLGLIDQSQNSFGSSAFILDHVRIRYASTGIEARTSMSMNNSTIEQSRDYGVFFDAAGGDEIYDSFSLQNCQIDDGPNSMANIMVQNLTIPMTLQNCTLRSQSGVALDLHSTFNSQFQTGVRIINNTVIQSSDQDAVVIHSVGNSVQLSDNIITRDGGLTETPPPSVGLAVLNGTPLLINTTISGFMAPMLLEGYPTTSIVEDLNTYSGNQLSGIALSGRIGTGRWVERETDPYFIWSDDLTIEAGATLTLPVGIVIKSAGGKLILGEGSTLKSANSAVTGTPIILTSVRDDTAGGDFNNDGANSAPAPGDWGGIEAPGSDVSTFRLPDIALSNVEIRYADVALYSEGNLNLSDSTIESSRSYNLLATAPVGRATQLRVERNTFEPSTTSTSLSIRGQPSQMLIIDNLVTCVDQHCLYLRDVNSGSFQNNQLSHSGTQNAAIFFQDVGDQFVVSDNDIQHFGTAAQAAFAAASSAPQLISNTVRGFDVAVWVDGFPQFTPSYTNNTFVGNRYSGVALGNTLTNGIWNHVGGYNHFVWFDDLLLASGVALAIPAGTTIESAGGGLILEADATLNAIGNATEPIVFTRASALPQLPNLSPGGDTGGRILNASQLSNDTTAGEVTASDALAALPAGDWTGLVGHGSQDEDTANSTLNLQYVEVRHATTAIQTSGNLILTNGLLESNYRYDIAVEPFDNQNSDQRPNILVSQSTLRNGGIGFATNLFVSGQPRTLTIQDNVVESTRAFALQLSNVITAQISGNQISQTSSLNPAIYLENVGEQVVFSNNGISRGGQDQATAGILSVGSLPQLRSNTVSGFQVAIDVEGFPQSSPIYSSNVFTGNQYSGIALRGKLTSGLWNAPSEYPHFIGDNDLLLSTGISLTIPAGQIIKSAAGALVLEGGSSLNALGTVENPIILTSIKDDAHGGDTNNDGSQSLPDPGDWGGIRSQVEPIPATLNLGHLLLRYAETGLDTKGNLTLNDGIIEWSNLQAIQLSPPTTATTSVTLQRSILRNGAQDGLAIETLPKTLTLQNNAIYNNSRFGLQDTSNSGSAVNAMGIWWGDAVGPKSETGDAVGIGDMVTGNVNYAEWLTAPPSYVTDAPPATDDPVEPPADPSLPPGFEPPPIATPPSTLSTADTYEENNICANATALEPNGALQEHSFHADGDVDWVRFNALAGQSYRIEVQTRANSTADVTLEVYGECDGAVTDEFSETFTPGVRLDLDAIVDGPLYLRLANSRADIFGEDAVYAVSVSPIVAAQSQEAQGAIILMEGRLKIPDRLQPNIANVIREAYDLFKSRGYSDDNIQYLSVDPTAKGVDDVATAANLQDAITEWASTRVGIGQPLTIYIMDHGNIDRIYVDEPIGERVAPDQVHEWLNILEREQPNVKATIVIEACHSGSFIDGPKSVSKPGRIVISSTNVQNVAYASADGAQFSDRFLDSLQVGYGLASSFWDARNAVKQLYKIQDPWIDTNGNGIPNEQADLEQGTDDHNPGTGNQLPDFWAPYIVSAEGPDRIVDGRGTIRAEVRDNKAVRRVWGVVYAPSYRAPTDVEELIPEDVPTFDFVLHGNDIYGTEYTNFTEEGTYRVAIFAEDNDGLKARLWVLEIPTGAGPPQNSVFLPLIQQ